MLIAGDIGATTTRLALYLPDAGARNPIVADEFHTADYRELAELVQGFITRAHRSVEVACFAVAGPVVGGPARLTNVPWVIEEKALQHTLGLKLVMLLNDLEALAHAVPHLRPEDTCLINAGKPEAQGPVAVIAPGTGLGEAFLIWSDDRYTACPSEGGHADFGPTNRTQAALWEYLFKRYGHVAYERLCSGTGLPNIYDFLRDTGRAPELPGFGPILAAASDRTPLIPAPGTPRTHSESQKAAGM